MALSRDAAIEFLHGRINYERDPAVQYTTQEFRLARMREILARLGDPGGKLPVVHVAGTKGKGSTSAMVASILTAAGHRSGLYASPHLHDPEERVQADGRPVSAAEFVDLVEAVRPVAEEMDAEARGERPRRSAAGTAWDWLPGGPTYFELMTAMALVCFERRGVETAVLEVGLGGRLDSTNVCRPAVCAIASISFDHTRQLGGTLAQIAGEKAGIVKPGVPVVCGVVKDEPRAVIAETCRRQGAPLVQLGVDFDFEYQPPHELGRGEGHGRMTYRRPASGDASPRLDRGPFELGLLGRHQAANAAVAIAVCEELRRQGWSIPEEAMRRGLADVRLPARVEVVRRRPTVIIDAAHNVASVEALVRTLDESFSPSRRILVLGTSRDKDVLGMLRVLLPHFQKAIFTRYLLNPRGVPAEELAEAARGHATPFVVCPDPAAAWNEAASDLAPDDLVCVTGSFFLAGEMERQVQKATSRDTASQPR
ncbi:MAG: bifunctional folylpolyglutamate synthase/dihydrofolate synthase [Planctomycetia bacterium]|nr:bifunctional folylpolyglutamate synthase/dihydrofolate synthase [Planctomycetia bacterium]